MRTQILQSTETQPGRRADAAHGWTYAALGALAVLPAAGALLLGGTAIAHGDTDYTDCGGGASAGPDTSCPFAENVREKWMDVARGAVNVDINVYSPETNEWYTMNCVRQRTDAGSMGNAVVCRGGNDAAVLFIA